MEQGKIHTFIEEGIGWIKFYHPKGNSLPSVLLNEIARAIHLYDKDASVRVIAIASEGASAFCAGACRRQRPAGFSPEHAGPQSSARPRHCARSPV